MSQEVIAFLQRLEKKIDEKFEQMDQKFEQIDRKFESIDKKFDRIDQKFDQVDKRLSSHEKMLAQLIELVTATNQRLEQFEKETHKRFDTLELKVYRMESDMNLLFKDNVETKRDMHFIKEKVFS